MSKCEKGRGNERKMEFFFSIAVVISGSTVVKGGCKLFV